MEVSIEVGKIIKCTIYGTGFREAVVYQAYYQGFQFDTHFIQCQTSTYILIIGNGFFQYVQNYFQYVYIPI